MAHPRKALNHPFRDLVVKGCYGGNQHYLAILPRVIPGPQVHRDAGGLSRHDPRHAGGPRHHGGVQGEKGLEPQKQGTAQHTINKYWKEYNIKEVWRGKGWRPSNVHPPPTHHATRPPQPYALPFAGYIEKRVHRTSSAARSGCAGAMNSSRCAVGDGAVMTGRVCPAGWTGCGILVPVVLGGQYAPRTLRRSVPPCGPLELGWFLSHLNRGQDTESAVINGIESGHTLRVIQNRDRRRLAWGLAPCVPRHKTDAEAAGQGAPAHTIDAGEGDNVT